MQRPRTRGATAAGEMKRRAMQQSPRHQTVMMARCFATERCANASIPVLGFDASMLAVPFKCSLLDISSTSPSSSSATSSSALPQAMDPSASSATTGSSSGRKRHGRPPGSRNKAEVPAQWTPGAGGLLRIGAPMEGKANCATSGASSALTLRGPAPGGALNAPSPVAVAPAPRTLGSIDWVLREVEATLGPLPPTTDGPGPQEVAPPATGVVATPHRLAAEMLGPLIAPGSRFLELLVVINA
jgi:hypothetical protein